AWRDELRTILNEGEGYGLSKVGANERVNVEYVSANPTGPMHVGHCRGAVVGDSPEGMYPGEYLKPVGEILAAEHGDKYAEAAEAEWLPVFREASIKAM